MNKFDKEKFYRIKSYKKKTKFIKSAKNFLKNSIKEKYSYNFNSLGLPIIQYPQDIVVAQELIWKIKPDLIIETGIARGGSLISNASMLALIDISEAIKKKKKFNPLISKRKVIGIDIDLRLDNKKKIKNHPMSSRIQILEGSSTNKDIVKKVKDISKKYKKIMVFLDSNHSEEHVYQELLAYASLVSINSYCIVYDTVIEDLPKNTYPDRPWGRNNNPKTAVKKFLNNNDKFKIDKNIEDKLLITVSPSGFLKKIK